MNVTLIPILDDNYCYVFQSADQLGLVDPGEAQPVIDFLDQNNLTPDLILNTHHHGDHIAGNAEIMKRYSCKLIGPAAETARIPNMTRTVQEGDSFSFGEETFDVIETPGHTSGHICFYAQNSRILFAGDTLFSMGCGRLFEGSAEQMYASLEKLKALPDDTLLYCGHEYTASNGAFCLTQYPENTDLQARMEEVKKLRDNNHPTLPVSLGLEKKTNIFLTAKNAQEFARFRSLKDNA